MTLEARQELRLLHQRLAWWDGELIPALASEVSRWPIDWHRHQEGRVRLRDLALERLRGRGMPESQVHAYVAHAMACAFRWPDYRNPADMENTAAPRYLFTGLLPTFDDPNDETLELQPLYYHARWVTDGTGATWITESKPHPREGIAWSPAGRNGLSEAQCIEAARLKDDERWTHKQIGEHFGWPLQENDHGKLARCRTSEEAVKRGRPLRLIT